MKVSVFHSTLHLEILLFFKLQYLKKIFNVKNQNNDEQQWPALSLRTGCLDHCWGLVCWDRIYLSLYRSRYLDSLSASLEPIPFISLTAVKEFLL